MRIASSLLLLLALLAIVVIGAMMASGKSRRSLCDSPRACTGCGTVHPGHANYCRHCGRKLP